MWSPQHCHFLPPPPASGLGGVDVIGKQLVCSMLDPSLCCTNVPSFFPIKLWPFFFHKNILLCFAFFHTFSLHWSWVCNQYLTLTFSWLLPVPMLQPALLRFFCLHMGPVSVYLYVLPVYLCGLVS